MIEPTATTARPKGVALRLLEFYRNNPTEELTFRHIMVKYGCTLWTARKAVYQLERDGQIESVHIIRAKGQLLIDGVNPKTKRKCRPVKLARFMVQSIEDGELKVSRG